MFSSAVCAATNSTWFQNQARAQTKITGYGSPNSQYEGAANGGAIYQSGNTLALAYCTIASNSIVSLTNTGAAITLVSNATAQLSACLLAGKTSTNLAGLIMDLGFNLSSDHSVPLTAASIYADPKLGDFGDHGGPTPTLALLPGSPAIDAVTSGACLATDQRGVPRPIGAACDIGTFEFVPAPILSLDPGRRVSRSRSAAARPRLSDRCLDQSD